MLKQYHFFKHDDVVTTFYLDPMDFDKWFSQNSGEYTGNYFSGVLQDNFVVSCRRGYAFLYEHYINANSSDFSVYFIPYKEAEKHNKAYDNLWTEFLSLKDAAQEREVI